MKPRYFEIDLLRTLAIVMMIIYHIAFDLHAYYGWTLNPFGGGWWILARSTAILFLTLVGVSFVISSQKNILKRSAVILGCAMIVTLATYLFDPNTYVRFGILHSIAVSILILPCFTRLKEWNAVVGVGIIILGRYMDGIHASTSLLLPLGITPYSFQTVDYFPLLPWFGVILIGMSIGHFFYVRRERTPITYSKGWQILTVPGRRALIVYMVHQPLILLILALLLN